VAHIVRETRIDAPRERVFDLARHVEAHVETMPDERAEGVTGLLELGDCVTFRQRQFGVPFALTAEVTALDRPRRFVDESVLDCPSDDVVLVDTGLWRNSPDITAELKGVGYPPGEIDRVLLTHYDLDHVGGLDRLVPAFDGPVAVGRADLDMLSGRTQPPWRHHKGLFHRVSRRLRYRTSGWSRSTTGHASAASPPTTRRATSSTTTRRRRQPSWVTSCGATTGST